MFSPFDLTRIEVRHHDHSYGLAVPHLITRHAHPKARPETPEPPPAPATGIAYLDLVTAAHHEQIAADARIGFQALYSPQPDPTDPDTDAEHTGTPHNESPQETTR